MKFIPRTRVFLLWFLSLGVALVSLRFLILGIGPAFGASPEMADHIANRGLAFALHIIASPLALTLGLFQFVPRLRARRPALHRWTGRLYVLCVAVGGLSGLVVAAGMSDRPVATVGFSILAVLWLSTTTNALRLAMAGQIEAHRRWMLRSYALTFAAVTLRLQMPLFIIFAGMDYGELSNYVAWLAWIPNLIFIEMWLRRKRPAMVPTPA